MQVEEWLGQDNQLGMDYLEKQVSEQRGEF